MSVIFASDQEELPGKGGPPPADVHGPAPRCARGRAEPRASPRDRHLAHALRSDVLVGDGGFSMTLDQAAHLAKALLRGEPNRERIALTLLADKVREQI
jgi:hypothetical protein